MGKKYVLKGFKLPGVEKLAHDTVVMENKAGTGGGRHLMLDIWDSTQDHPDELKDLRPFVAAMLQVFEAQMKSVTIRNYRVEHRVYVMDKEEFVGRIHDDSCEFTIIWYYHIDPDIVGGALRFFDDDGTREIDSFTPAQNDLLILDGVHALGPMSAKRSDTRRSILIVQINSEES